MPIQFSKKGGEKEASSPIEKDVRGWVRRVEQQINSLDKRLDAIERRLSGEERPSPPIKITEDGLPPRAESPPPHDIAEEVKNLRSELHSLQERWDEKSEKRGTAPTIQPPLKRASPSSRQVSIQEIADIERRLEGLEKQKPAVTVRGIEVPIEITGIVGGVLAFIVAGLLHLGYQSVVLSPLFVALLGTVLVLAAAIKTHAINTSKK